MDKEKTSSIRLLTIFVFVSFSAILLWNLGGTYLTNWDEAWHADMARNMVKTGNLITPIWNGKPFFDKPPLYFWLTALAFKLFNVSEFSARFFSALSGLGTVLVMYLLARLLFNSTTALLSLVVLSSTIGFLYRARTGNLDLLLTFWILLSILSFYKGYMGRGNGWFWMMGVSIGLGFLTKGMVLFVFPALAILYLLVKKEYKVVASPPFIGGILLGIVISLSWALISFLVNGREFLHQFFLNQTEKWTPTLYFWQNFSLTYISFLRSGLKWWFILFLPSFSLTFYYWRKTASILLLLYFSLMFITLSFSENKSNWFLVPFYPLVSIMIGFTVWQMVRKFSGQKFIAPIIFFLMVVAALQNITYRDQYMFPDVAGDEARVALVAKNLTEKDDFIYLTNYYYPTIAYYSERKIYAVYSEQEKNPAWWIRPETDWGNILEGKRVFIITTKEEIEKFQKYFSKYKFELLYQSGEKLLLKKV